MDGFVDFTEVTDMAGVDTRNDARSSTFMLADVILDGDDRSHRVRIRNLSERGMMAEGPLDVERGSLLTIELRGAGKVRGAVAWREGDRFGIALEKEIDPAKVGTASASRPNEIVNARPYLREVGDGLKKRVDPEKLRRI